jgi:hypothetical protein
VPNGELLLLLASPMLSKLTLVDTALPGNINANLLTYWGAEAMYRNTIPQIIAKEITPTTMYRVQRGLSAGAL